MFITEFEDNLLTAVIDGADLQKWKDEIIYTNNTGILHASLKNVIVSAYHKINNSEFPRIDGFSHLRELCVKVITDCLLPFLIIPRMRRNTWRTHLS